MTATTNEKKIELKITETLGGGGKVNGIITMDGLRFKKRMCLYDPKKTTRRERVASKVVDGIAKKYYKRGGNYGFINITIPQRDINFLQKVLKNRTHPARLQVKRQEEMMEKMEAGRLVIPKEELLDEADGLFPNFYPHHSGAILLLRDNLLIVQLESSKYSTSWGLVRWRAIFSYNGIRTMKLGLDDNWTSEPSPDYWCGRRIRKVAKAPLKASAKINPEGDIIIQRDCAKWPEFYRSRELFCSESKKVGTADIQIDDDGRRFFLHHYSKKYHKCSTP